MTRIRLQFFFAKKKNHYKSRHVKDLTVNTTRHIQIFWEKDEDIFKENDVFRRYGSIGESTNAYRTGKALAIPLVVQVSMGSSDCLAMS